MKPDSGILLKRRIVNKCMTGLFTFALLISLGALVAILWKLVISGFQAFSPALFLKNTPAPGTEGGLLNAIVGSILLVASAMLFAVPSGVLAGTFLAEYGRRSRLGAVVRFCNDIMLSAPSIIIGLFIYSIVVLPAGHFSAWAGTLSLCLIAAASNCSYN